MQSAQVVHAHQPRDAMFAAGFSGFAQVQEDPRGAVDPLARGERGADEAEQPRVLLGSLRDRLRKPLVVPARGDVECAAHHLHALPIAMGLDAVVRQANAPRTQSRGHRRLPGWLTGWYACPLKPGNFRSKRPAFGAPNWCGAGSCCNPAAMRPARVGLQRAWQTNVARGTLVSGSR